MRSFSLLTTVVLGCMCTSTVWAAAVPTRTTPDSGRLVRRQCTENTDHSFVCGPQDTPPFTQPFDCVPIPGGVPGTTLCKLIPPNSLPSTPPAAAKTIFKPSGTPPPNPPSSPSPIDPNLVFPRNHNLTNCPLATWFDPTFTVLQALPTLETSQAALANSWNASYLKGPPISGGASTKLSYFQGPLAPDALACQISAYTHFTNGVIPELHSVIQSTDITLFPDIQYAFSYDLGVAVSSIFMNTYSEPSWTANAWNYVIDNGGTMGGVEFVLTHQLKVFFIIVLAEAPTGDVGGSIAVFKEGP